MQSAIVQGYRYFLLKQDRNIRTTSDIQTIGINRRALFINHWLLVFIRYDFIGRGKSDELN